MTRLADVKNNVFTKDDGILIKVLRVTVPESCWKNFLTRTGLVQHGPTFAADWHYRLYRSPAAAEKVRSAQETCKCLQMATTLSTNCNWWYCVRTAKATFRYWKLLFLSSIFKQLLLENCAVDFVEICNVCTRKAIIKAAKRISILIRFVVVILISILASLFWNTV